MRHLLQISILFIIINHCAVGQTTSLYKFEYKIPLHDSDQADSSSLKIQSVLNGEETARIKARLIDENGVEVIGVPATFNSADTAITAFIRDEKSFSLSLKPGYYILTVAIPEYKKLEQQLQILTGNDYFLEVRLAPQLSGMIYNVRSKAALTKVEIQRIKNCILDNRNKFNDCSKKGSYFVSMQM